MYRYRYIYKKICAYLYIPIHTTYVYVYNIRIYLYTHLYMCVYVHIHMYHIYKYTFIYKMCFQMLSHREPAIPSISHFLSLCLRMDIHNVFLAGVELKTREHTLQHTLKHILQHTLQHTATRTATRTTTHTTTHLEFLGGIELEPRVFGQRHANRVSKSCCSVLQCVAACCSELQ